MTDVEEQEYDGVKIGKAFFISKSDKNYKKLINKIKSQIITPVYSYGRYRREH